MFMSSQNKGETSDESLLNRILDIVRKEPTYLNYWNAYRRIKKLDLSRLQVDEKKKVRIALLSSFTIDPLAIYLDIESRIAGLYPEIYVGPFNQYPQEILNDESKLYRFNPDLIIIAVHADAILEENFLPRFPTLSEDDKKNLQVEIVEYLSGLLSKLTSKTKALILLNNFVAPWFSPLGILDNKVNMGLREFFQKINQKLADLYRENKQVYVFDIDGLASMHGKIRSIDYEMYYRGAFFFSKSFLPVVAREYMGYVKALKNLTRKCIVLDLDNVLWGGILGEEGFHGIKLGGDPVGRAYVDFQRLLLSYYNRGILLAINSKNNLDEAMKVIQEHPNMVLREKNFAAIRINWRDKAENMLELSDELGIGLDSMVFVDDSPQERERMRQALPEVLVVDLPQSPFRYCQALQSLNDFNTLVLSEEDIRRGEMYYARRKRKQLMKTKKTLEEFLKSLNMTVEIKYANKYTIPRITSLINRTNQFNLTTRRYTQAEVEEMSNHPDKFQIYSLRVTDRFGDEGIVGVAIIRKEREKWIIDSFLMSCRVIGRKIETAFLAKIVEDAKKNGVLYLIGEHIPTKKNKPASSFYKDHGFEKIYEDKKISRWRLNLKESTIKMPEWVKMKDG